MVTLFSAKRSSIYLTFSCVASFRGAESRRFFGRYLKTGGEEYSPAFEKLMFECLEIDANPDIKKVGSLELLESLEMASYGYRKDVAELLQHYQEDVSWRIQNSINYEKKPEELFATNRLLQMKAILKR